MPPSGPVSALLRMNAGTKNKDFDPAPCVRCSQLLVTVPNTLCISAPRNPPRPPARAQHLHVHGAHFKKLRCKCIASRRIWLHCLTQRCNSCARRAACTAKPRAAAHAAAPHVRTTRATRVHERRAVAQTTSPPRRATLVAHARRRDAPWRDGATRRHTSPPPARNPRCTRTAVTRQHITATPRATRVALTIPRTDKKTT